MNKAIISANDFNRMIRNLKKALRPRHTTSTAFGHNHSAELLHLEFKQDMVTCIAVDGFRVHQECISTLMSEGEFTCHILPPQLKAIGAVTVSLADGNAYVEFDDIRFATKQPNTELTAPGLDKINQMIGDDLRFEVAVQPKYLLDAINAMKNDRQIVLNVGNPLAPILLYPYDAMGTRTYAILPQRRSYSPQEWKTKSERIKDMQDKELKLLRKRLENLLSGSPISGEEHRAEVWEKASSLKAALDEYLKEDDPT